MTKNNKVIVYTDGGSRGNPGPSAVGVVVCDESGKIIKEYNQVLEDSTNNEAEYEAVIFALKKLKQLFGKDSTKNLNIEFRMDSQLVASQLGGEFKINEERMQALFIKVWNLKFEFGNIIFKYIPREKNKHADQLVNDALDGKSKNEKLL